MNFQLASITYSTDYLERKNCRLFDFGKVVLHSPFRSAIRLVYESGYSVGTTVLVSDAFVITQRIVTRCKVLFPILLELEGVQLTAAVWRITEFRVSNHSFFSGIYAGKLPTSFQGYLEKSGTRIRVDL